MSTPRSDQDSPWKEILRTYFPEAMQFFFPEVAQLIDWQRPYEFLDKELQQIAPESAIGKRYADQLVKVWQQGGPELWLLLHLEIQARPEVGFEERIFIYNFRIFDRFHHPVISLAILCDHRPSWRPQQFGWTYPGTQLSFQFGTVKLLDYRDRWSELEQSDNPFATVVMAHLKTQETRRSPSERKAWKFNLIRRLYERGYERRAILNLFRFIDWVMILPDGIEQAFWQELQTYEEERRMPYITSVERIGFERGERSLVLKQLTRRLGTLPPEVQAQIAALSLPQLETLGETLLEFTQLTDLQSWLEQHPSDRQT